MIQVLVIKELGSDKGVKPEWVYESLITKFIRL